MFAGRAAHLGYNFDDAYALYSKAVEYAQTTSDESDAAWGVCVAAMHLEDDRIVSAIAGLEALGSPRSKDLVRLDAAVYDWMFRGTPSGPISTRCCIAGGVALDPGFELLELPTGDRDDSERTVRARRYVCFERRFET